MSKPQIRRVHTSARPFRTRTVRAILAAALASTLAAPFVASAVPLAYAEQIKVSTDVYASLTKNPFELTAPADQTITMDTSANATLSNNIAYNGSGTARSKWRMSADGGSTWMDVADDAATISLQGLAAGAYIFECTVTDDMGDYSRMQTFNVTIAQGSATPDADSGSGEGGAGSAGGSGAAGGDVGTSGGVDGGTSGGGSDAVDGATSGGTGSAGATTGVAAGTGTSYVSGGQVVESALGIGATQVASAAAAAEAAGLPTGQNAELDTRELTEDEASPSQQNDIEPLGDVSKEASGSTKDAAKSAAADAGLSDEGMNWVPIAIATGGVVICAAAAGTALYLKRKPKV